jgi:hypothetical protein
VGHEGVRHVDPQALRERARRWVQPPPPPQDGRATARSQATGACTHGHLNPCVLAQRLLADALNRQDSL